MEGAPKSNPNRIGEVISLSKDLPTSSDKVYRHVRGDDAITDLFTHGAVRNGANAAGTSSKRWGDAVFWSKGEEGKFHNVPDGAHIIEAPHEVAVERTVTKDDVTAIYGRNADGEVENKLQELRARLGIDSAS